MEEAERIIALAFAAAGPIRVTADTPGVGRLAAEARRFLTEVGLPAGRVFWGFTFERAAVELPTLREVAARAGAACGGPLAEMSVFGDAHDLDSVWAWTSPAGSGS